MWLWAWLACGADPADEVFCRPVDLGKGRWSCAAVEACCTQVEADGSMWCEYTTEDGRGIECTDAEACIRLEEDIRCAECEPDMTLAAVCGQ